MPVVFLAHNGGGKKEDWGSFPSDLAGTDDVTKAMYIVLQKYGDLIDPDKAAFVGGCHGAAKFLSVLGNGTLMKKISVKTAVVLAVSETDNNMLKAAGKKTFPVLVMYSNRDPYGYTDVNKQFAKLLREPKTIVVRNEARHGNELLMYADTKESVTREIVAWLKEHMK